MPEDEDAGREAGAIEEIGAKADDGFQQVHAEEFPADLALLAHTEQGTVRQDDGHAPGFGGHGLDHVLHEGVVAALGGWHAGKVAAIGVAGPDFVAPFLQRERRIGDDAIEGGKAVAEEECWIPQCVAANDLEVRRTVQEEIHAGDGGGGEVFLLAEELAPERADIAPRFLHVVDGLQQHAAGAAGGVVNRIALARVEDVHHEPNDRARGVELAGLLVGDVGELLDQVFVGLAEDVHLGMRVSQGNPGEVFDQVAQQGV